MRVRRGRPEGNDRGTHLARCSILRTSRTPNERKTSSGSSRAMRSTSSGLADARAATEGPGGCWCWPGRLRTWPLRNLVEPAWAPVAVEPASEGEPLGGRGNGLERVKREGASETPLTDSGGRCERNEWAGLEPWTVDRGERAGRRRDGGETRDEVEGPARFGVEGSDMAASRSGTLSVRPSKPCGGQRVGGS